MLGAAILSFLGGPGPGAASAQDGLRIAVPPIPVEIEETVEIGELKNELELDAKVASVVEVQRQRLHLDSTFSAPDLYAKLLAALSSRDPSGCSVIYRSEEDASGVVAELCDISDVSIAFDESNKSASLRGKARLRKQIDGGQRDTAEYGVTVELAPSIRNGSLILDPRSLDIDGIPDAANALILRAFEPAEIPLHQCLVGVDLDVEDLELEQGADSMTAAASCEVEAALRAVACFGTEQLMRLGSGIR